MKFIGAASVYLAVTLAAQATAFPGKILQSRDELLAEYDYIVVGGGMAGLVVASRITEKSSSIDPQVF